MNIQEATKLATKELLTMTRKEWKESHQAQVLPTNDSFLNCILSSNDGKCLVRYWQPSADDLMADDWEVINPIRDQELLKQF
ncbi:DUF2829 domain-containing protein [Staphylococcus pettenkoferi]|uniref:Thoeris anti-defense Tad2 family protein n=1 Tax=Staphylococcus pettenkoferi TaxID=170573 RepID=UPI000CCFD648|nr:MW1434 family type I TA system toxin [Staphylococcus pettenkoferi]MCY1585621.1 DUF2829 domain-containing protein [Staphylococcus pettenkoferi]PNZ87766.1 DUF2829 domain-containing protein [Staphylococcus pettenkoferi]QQC36810.1 DUF2829 domain-containing protein [Staphylococcus pettenkoferi]